MQLPVYEDCMRNSKGPGLRVCCEGLYFPSSVFCPLWATTLQSWQFVCVCECFHFIATVKVTACHLLWVVSFMSKSLNCLKTWGNFICHFVLINQTLLCTCTYCALSTLFTDEDWNPHLSHRICTLSVSPSRATWSWLGCRCQSAQRSACRSALWKTLGPLCWQWAELHQLTSRFVTIYIL